MNFGQNLQAGGPWAEAGEGAAGVPPSRNAKEEGAPSCETLISNSLL